MKMVACIFARGGSKGVPRKNIRPLGGKPLIGHAIDVARASTLIDRVIVSTDDEEIAAVAREFGAEVPFMRPAELATDRSPEWLSWKHAAQFLRSESDGEGVAALVSVPATSPLRRVEDVDAVIQAFDPATVDAVLAVREAQRNPYFNMVRVDPDGYARIVLAQRDGPSRRQDAPPIFDITTVADVAGIDYILSAPSFFTGRIKAVEVPASRSIDIDTEEDFAIAEFLLQRAQAGRPAASFRD
ncbi:MAG TPA: acylneuraminate cytidylyltransferase family protein [Chthoniobacter sp.]|jgi:N-acylneuraminate cytidylyltransferase